MGLMFGRTKSRPQKVRELQKKVEKHQRKAPEKALVALAELEELEPTCSRWPHKRGDLLRRLERKAEAVGAYERAATLYAEYGFLVRAIAMAKVILEVDPARIEVLQRLDPSAARALHRKARPEGVHVGEEPPKRSVGDTAERLVPVPEETKTRFSEAPGPIELELSEIEFEERSAAEVERPLSAEVPGAAAAPAHAASPQARPETEEEAAARRLASLPLLPLFAEAPRAALLELAKGADLLELEAGHEVIREGDPADALYGIVEGAVRVEVPGLEPHQYPRLAEGDVFGESALLSGEPRKARVVVEGGLLALRIPKQTLSYLVRVHRGLGEVLLELLTRRLLSNLVYGSRLFRELDTSGRHQLASSFELRRAPAGTVLLEPGKCSDGLYITLTGLLEVGQPGLEPRLLGAGTLLGHASMLDRRPSRLQAQARNNLLCLRLSQEAFSRIAMQYPDVLLRMSEMGAVGHLIG